MKNKIISAVAAILAFLSPTVVHSQAPNLGSAAGFALFTTVGAITSVPPTYITGHVGSNSGAGTGFGNVNGNMYSSNGITALCAADLLAAYGQLNSTIAGFFPASPLGNGATLTAGVYSLSGNTVLSNTLTLNAQGVSTAVFIFLINGTFASNAGAKIVLTNGALACNVFWKVEGVVSLATNSTLRGTIIANNAAINISPGVTLEGRALSTGGAISVDKILAYTPLGCTAPVLTGPAAPSLLSAACFALFSSNGAVTNVGITTVTGDVGSNNGLTTGYNPLFVSGSIHAIPDLATTQCSVDLGTVYTYLNGLANDITLLFPAQFGNKLVLTPHTYLMNGAVSLTDTLYLNAQGNASAVFVIQVNGAFSSAAGSKIILINGAQAKNVFWKIDGALNLFAGAVAKGTFIVNNAAILLAVGAELEGRALTTTGALSTSANTVALPPFNGSGSSIAQQTVCAGSSASFATGGGNTYQWRLGTVNIVNGGNISGATSATLVFNPVNQNNAALNYNVIVSGSCGQSFTSSNTALVVNNSPSITSQAASQTVCGNGQAGFTIVASGSGLTYQWRKGNINLSNGGSISGATSATLNINPVSQSNVATDYNVIVSGSCAANFTSANVALAVGDSPTLTASAVSQTVCAGISVTFAANASGSGLSYQWRDGTNNLNNGGSISGANTPTLIISVTSTANASTGYNLVVTGGCAPNVTTTNVSLKVNEAPGLILAPLSQTVCAGTSVAFLVNASGSGLNYQWKSGTANVVNSSNITGANTPTLSFNNAVAANASGAYALVISGDCAPDFTTANISLAVNLPPDLTVQPFSRTVCAGNPVSFIVVPNGTNVTYQWRKGNTDLVNSNTLTGVTGVKLDFNSTSSSDAGGDYNVVLHGLCAPGYTSSNFELTVNQNVVVNLNSNSPVCTGSVINLLSDSVAGASYTWTGPDNFSSPLQNPKIVSASALTAGSYTLMVTVNGCTSVPKSILLAIKTCVDPEFFIPQGFSPNNDGINDYFVIRGIDRFPGNNIVIFNRWGNKVFEASPYNNSWDGKANTGVRMNDSDLPVGTYFYVLELGDGSKFYKGTIYLNK
jgi:gliding motility-associated-like protein